MTGKLEITFERLQMIAITLGETMCKLQWLRWWNLSSRARTYVCLPLGDVNEIELGKASSKDYMLLVWVVHLGGGLFIPHMNKCECKKG